MGDGVSTLPAHAPLEEGLKDPQHKLYRLYLRKKMLMLKAQKEHKEKLEIVPANPEQKKPVPDKQPDAGEEVF